MRLGRGLRSALYHRFHVLVPFVSNRLVRGLGRALVWGFWLAYFGFVLTILALRYSVLPHIEDYRTDIEHLASQGLGQTVSIGRIEASWEGINPDLTLLDVRIAAEVAAREVQRTAEQSLAEAQSQLGAARRSMVVGAQRPTHAAPVAH